MKLGTLMSAVPNTPSHHIGDARKQAYSSRVRTQMARSECAIRILDSHPSVHAIGCTKREPGRKFAIKWVNPWKINKTDTKSPLNVSQAGLQAQHTRPNELVVLI